MSKSLIYTVNTSVQELPINGVINPGTVIRRFGQNLNLSGNGIQVAGSGYYKIDANFTLAPTAAGEATITAYLDGVEIPGATATETVAAGGDFINLSIDAVIREGCPCCDTLRTITFVLSSGASSITNSAIVVEKI